MGSNTVSVYRNISVTGSITSGSFAAKVDFTTGSAPYYLAIGDVDGDGKPDVLVTNGVSYTLSVLRNTSTSGSISFATKVDFPTGGPNGVAIRDLDGDGKPELVVANAAGPGTTISVFRNTSTTGSITTGSFAAKVDFTTGGTSPSVVAIADVDGDGKPDLVVNGNGVGSVFRNTSTTGSITSGSFATRVDLATGNGPVDAFDADGDGKLDIVAVDQNTNTLSLFRNTSTVGSMTFAPKVDFPTASANGQSIAIGDLDGDGKPEIVVTHYSINKISIYRNQSTSGNINSASLAARVEFSIGTGPAVVAIGDVDGDGKPDLAVANNGSNTVSAFRNTVAPQTPQNLTATAGSGQVMLKWNKISESRFLRYRIYRGTSPSATTKVDSTAGGNLSDTSKTLTGLTNGTIYYFRITAVDSAGNESGYSNEVSATPLPPPAVVSVIPTKNALNVVKTANISATFNVDINPSSLTNATIKVNGSQSGFHISSNISYNSSTKTVTFDPNVDFRIGELATITMAKGIKNANGDSLVNPFVWSFRISVVGGTGVFAQSDVVLPADTLGIAVTGDIDNDGDVDVVVTTSNSSQVKILKNDGTGTLTHTSTAAAGSVPSYPVLGDMDGDGDLDLVIANYNSNTVTILWNNGTGSFSTSTSVVVGSAPHWSAVVDIDGDGDLDLVVERYSLGATILKNNGTGSFTETQFLAVNGSNSVVAGDIDGDGDFDLAIDGFPSSISIYKNDGTGFFSFHQSPTVVSNPGLVAIDDLDADGDIDIVVMGENDVGVLKNDGTGNFSQTSTLSLGGYGHLITGDWDGDGDIDIAVDISQLAVTKILNNNGTGVFSLVSQSYQYGVSAAADLDSDGDLDWILIPNFSGPVTIWKNQGGNAPPLFPQSLIATAGNQQVTLRWNKNTEPDFLRYRIYRGTSPSPTTKVDSTLGGNSNDTSKTLTGLTNGTTYYFRVTAVDSTENESAYSNEVSATPFGVPTITSFSATSGPIGTSVTITGTNFNSTASKNVVYFGAVKASVSSANSTTLSVTVPVGATFAPLTITDTTTGLTAYSSAPFVVTFPNSGVIDVNSFAGKMDFTVGTDPSFVRVADIDADGKSDLVCTNASSNSVSVLRNTSTLGNLSFGAKADFLTPNTPLGLFVGDVDGDGKLDIVVANNQGGNVSVFRNTSTIGAISFDSRIDLVAAIGLSNLALADLDGDGKPEIVVSSSGNAVFSVFKNSSTPGSVLFASKIDFATDPQPSGLSIRDLDGDGKPDVVVTNVNSSTMSVFRNSSTVGSISFDPRVNFSVGTFPYITVIGDIDGDGKAEIVVANNGSTSVSVLRNTSTAGTVTSSSFATKIDFTTGASPFAVSTADVDGDGKLDVVVNNSGGNTVSVLRNTSSVGSITSSSLSAKVDFATGTNPYSGLAVGDLDGDGRPELSVGNRGGGTGNTISVLRNTVVPIATPANLTATSGNAQVTLRWNKINSSYFLRYRIYRGTSASPTTKVDSTTGGITDTVKTITGLTNGTTYYFRITAVDSAGNESIYSNEVSATPQRGNYNADANTMLLLHMDETSGSIASDGSSFGNNGTATGTTIVDGRFGKTRSFGVSTDLISIPHSSTLNFGTSSFTVETWVKTLGSSIGGGTILHKRGGVQQRGWIIGFQSANGDVFISVYNDSAFSAEQGRTTLSSFRRINDGSWHHIAGVVTFNTLYLYIDGALENSTPVTIQGSSDNNGGLYVANIGGASSFLGTADEIRISNIARSPSDFNLQLPPRNLVATPSGTTVDLTWQNGGGAVPLMRYKIYRGIDSTNFAFVDSTASLSYTDSQSLTPQRYYYRISAVDSTGFESARSNVSSATILLPSKSIHVSTTGSDANPGSANSPLRNIQTALNQAVAGDTIKVANGIFTEILTLKATTLILGGYDSTFASGNRNLFKNKTVLRPSSGTILTDSSSSTIDGFGFDGSSGASRGITVSKGHSIITHNNIYGFSASGGWGIQVLSGASAVIKNNSLAGNKLSGGGVIFYALYINGNNNNATVIQNNIAFNNNVGIYISPSGVTKNYNCSFVNTFLDYDGTNGAAGANDVSADPRFVNPTNGDFRLKASSPCIDAGNPSDPVGSEPAPNGGRIDMGSYGGTINATSPALNSTTFVSTLGNDANPGTAASPFKTIQFALDNSIGDTIKVAGGIYTEALTTPSKTVLLGGYNESFGEAQRDIFVNKTSVRAVSAVMLSDANASTIDGFIFDGRGVPTDAGVKVSNGSVVTHNIVKGVTASFAAGIEVNGGAIVANNTVMKSSYGIEFRTGTGTPSVRNNIVAFNSFGMVQNAFTAAVRKYNDVISNSFNYTGFDTNPGTGDISLNPQFVDTSAAVFDLRIAEASPCVDAGDPADPVGSEPAPNGNRIDIGTYGGTKYSPYRPTPPSIPNLVSPTNGAANQPTTITLRWNKSEGAASYRVQVSRASTFLSQVVVNDSTVTDTSKTVPALLNNITYFWRVNAKNANGTSGYSATFSFVTQPDTIAPAAPQNLTAIPGNGQVTLRWSRNVEQDLATYRVYGEISPGPTTLIYNTAAATDTSAVITGLTNGTRYYFRNKAVDISNNASPYSNEVASVPQVPPLLGEYTADANTVLLLRMNETTGTNVEDVSGNGNNGTATGTTIVDGRFGKARGFDGNTDVIQILQNSSINFSVTKQFTTEAWVRVDNFTTRNSQVVGKWVGGSADWTLNVNTDGRVELIIYNGIGTFTNVISTLSLERFRWYHLAAVWNGNNGLARVYVNGKVEAETNNAVGSLAFSATIPLVGVYHSGRIDEVRLSSVIRSSSEFNLQLPPKNVTASATGTTINLTWQNGGGGVGLLKYYIYRGPDSTNVSLIDSTTQTSYANLQLSSGTTYYYRVGALDLTGFEGAKSFAAFATATGQNRPFASLDLTKIDFGSREALSAQRDTTITLTNIGSANLGGGASIGGSDASNFSIQSGGGSFSLSPGQSRSIVVRFRPLTFGSKNATILLFTNDSTHFPPTGVVTDTLTGFGSDVTAPPTAAASFSPQGWSSSALFTISNLNVQDASGIDSLWYRYDAAPTAANRGGKVKVNAAAAQVPPPSTSGTHTLYTYLQDGAGNYDLSSTMNFTVQFDNTLPTITHDSSAVLSFNTGSPSSIAISAAASDGNSGMKSLQLQYRRSGTSWSTASTVNYASVLGGSASIPAANISALANFGVDYRIAATDSANNVRYTPTFSIGIRYNQEASRTDGSGNPVTQPSTSSLPAGSPQEYAYRMFSVPLNLDNKTPRDVFETRTGLGAYDSKQWRFYSLNNSDGFDEYLSFSTSPILDPGKGFFLILKSGAVIKTGPGSIVKADSINKAGIQLRSGNNFVGNPFNFSVPIDSLSLSNGDLFTGRTWEFVGVGGTNGGWSLNPTTLKAWEGILVRTTSAALIKFKITDRPGSVPPSIARQQEGSDTSARWRVQIRATRTDNGLADIENILGVEPSASEGIDAFDAFEPPLFGQKTLSLSFPSPEAELTHDIRPVNDEGYVWDFKIQTPDEKAHVLLSFDGLSGVALPIRLFDIDTKMPYTLNDASRIEVNTNRGERRFRLIVGSLEFAQEHSDGIQLVPTEFVLYQNYPNPFNPETVVRYALPGNSTYHVSLKIYNLLGQEVATLVDADQVPGFYEAKLDGRSLSTGAYFYRIAVTGESRESSYSNVKRMMLLK